MVRVKVHIKGSSTHQLVADVLPEGVVEAEADAVEVLADAVDAELAVVHRNLGVETGDRVVLLSRPLLKTTRRVKIQDSEQESKNESNDKNKIIQIIKNKSKNKIDGKD